jgi:hypothetical protein
MSDENRERHTEDEDAGEAGELAPSHRAKKPTCP